PPAQGIAGTWEKQLASGGNVTLEIQDRALCFLASAGEDCQWTLEGEFEPKSDGLVQGTIKTLDVEQSNVKLSLPVEKEFTLSWRREADKMVILEFKGGGWDAKGEASL